jgi:DNA-binding PadR family transcriptional regulator
MLGVLELAILGVLAGEDLHGYELKSRIEALTTSTSFGSLYPALTRMARAGVVRTWSEPGRRERLTVPMTGSLDGEAAVFGQHRGTLARHRGKARKVYAITADGQRRLRDLLVDDDVGDRTFPVKLALAGHLEPEERSVVVQRRRQLLADRRVELKRHARDTPDHWRTVAIDRRISAIDDESRWLDGLDLTGHQQPDPTPTGGTP